MTTSVSMTAAEALAAGDVLLRAGHFDQARGAYLAGAGENPPTSLCLGIARASERLGERAAAFRWALRATDSAEDFLGWQAAAGLARRLRDAADPQPRRTARIAVLGSSTTSQLCTLLELACLRVGIAPEIYESPFGQYRQELLDPGSAAYAFDPDVVVLAVNAGDLALPHFSSCPDDDIADEIERWTSLWDVCSSKSRAMIVQYTFALPPEAPFGNLGATMAGTRFAMTQALNARLAGAAALADVAVVDCERLAGLIGKRRWFDRRYWFLAKQAVALDALPLLVRHTAAVVAARLGLSKKCLVLDLDNTLWGGVIGEDGLSDIVLGDTPEGEAFQAFQDSILDLKRRGVVLAVCSKNNLRDAREVFERHEAMRIRLDDVAAYVADWRSKPDQIRSVAEELDLGLDSLVFVDDNPAEREAVRQLLPEVDVLTLPGDPAGYLDALADYLLFEPAAVTNEDLQRTSHYQARREAARAAASSTSLEQFHRSLEMRAVVRPFVSEDMQRITQLVGKTNQFNLTTRRHSSTVLREFAADPSCVHMTLRLRDRFADHGLVAILIAFERAGSVEIDTWLMSCRVIGRTVEKSMLRELCDEALRRGRTELFGTFVPTTKNDLVRDLYERLGFERAGDSSEGATRWRYDLTRSGTATNDLIELVRTDEGAYVAA